MKRNTLDDIDLLFENFKEFLKEKNKRYGDSALKPVQIFSKADAQNSLLIRLDDKINRIKNCESKLRKNDIADVFGYLALYMISQNWFSFDDLVD